MKIPIEIIAEVANEQLPSPLPADLVQEIERRAQQAAEEEKAHKEPVQKKQFVVLLYDPEGIISDRDLDEFVATVAQIPEDDDTAATLDKLTRASYEYNISKKGRRFPVKTIGEACEAVPARFLKEQDLAIKTRQPVRVLVTDNQLPEGGGL